MIKTVNIKTNKEIREITPHIYGSKRNVQMNTKDIRTCLIKGAFVYEILSDGKLIKLDINNYNVVNEPAKVNANILNVDKTVQEPMPLVAPVITAETLEEVPVITLEPEEVAKPVVEVALEAEEAAKPVTASNSKKKHKNK